LKVAHLHGSSAFGCDVLSFDSEADCSTFKTTADRTLIGRLIEVKSGQVQLTDNEIRAARRHKTRYFIYRIAFEDGARDLATLTLLCDPLSNASALQQKLHIQLDRASARESFVLTPAAPPPSPNAAVPA
jgi:hypothetical protein